MTDDKTPTNVIPLRPEPEPPDPANWSTDDPDGLYDMVVHRRKVSATKTVIESIEIVTNSGERSVVPWDDGTPGLVLPPLRMQRRLRSVD